VVLNDCYHLVTLDRQRQIVVTRTVEFAERLQQALFQKWLQMTLLIFLMTILAVLALDVGWRLVAAG